MIFVTSRTRLDSAMSTATPTRHDGMAPIDPKHAQAVRNLVASQMADMYNRNARNAR